MVKAFLDFTYEAYARRIGEEFGKSVPAVFTDEPNYTPVFLKDRELISDKEMLVPWTDIVFLVIFKKDMVMISLSISALFF